MAVREKICATQRAEHPTGGPWDASKIIALQWISPSPIGRLESSRLLRLSSGTQEGVNMPGFRATLFLDARAIVFHINRYKRP